LVVLVLILRGACGCSLFLVSGACFD